MRNNLPYINVYGKKNTRSKIVTQILYGETFKKIKKNGSWIKIRNDADNYKGFIKKRFFPKNQKNTHKICSLSACLYSKPNIKIKKKLSFGSKIKVTERKNNFYKTCIIRPATVCGVSKKMRFDLSVNILTNFAYNKKFINVFGGEQKRPNVHIDDLVNFYNYLSKEDFSNCNNESFNFGRENLKIIQIANKVKKIVEKFTKNKIDINVIKSSDIRSYHVNSDKYKKFFKYRIKKTVDDAIYDLCNYFKKNKIHDSFSNPNYYNVKKLIKINLK